MVLHRSRGVRFRAADVVADQLEHSLSSATASLLRSSFLAHRVLGWDIAVDVSTGSGTAEPEKCGRALPQLSG